MVVAVASFLAYSYLKLKIVGTAFFLRSSLRGLKAETNELLAERFCLKLSFVKWSVLRTNA